MAEAPVALKPFEEGIEKLIARLRRAELPEHVFNFYRQNDPELDARGGAARRRENLRRYLKTLKTPKFAFIGIAPGYRGARFTGVPFSDEHRLCYPGSCYDRTSTRENAYKEATAKVVMELLGARTDVVCWNLVPWHPHENGKLLSNSDPDKDTIELGLQALDWFFERLYPNVQRICVGKLVQKHMQAHYGEEYTCVRHPARGGADEFRTQASELLGINPEESDE
ncbi:MAG: uracil-DNA glycosylase [Planctomycetota bacterium]|jgi:hypothetical protein